MRKAKQSVTLLFRIEKLHETAMEKMVELPLTWNKFHSSDTLAEGKETPQLLKGKPKPQQIPEITVLDEQCETSKAVNNMH